MISKLTPLSILLLIASCASTVATDPEPELVDVRQGNAVKQICFARSINGWRELRGQRQSVILTKGIKDEYKLDLSGVCDVSNAMNNIATRTRGSSCLTRGDEIIVSNGFSGTDRCLIKKIYRWDFSLLEEDKAPEDATDTDNSK